MKSDDVFVLRIRKRPWWMWLLALLWLLVEIFFLQTAIASAYEFQRQAAIINWVIFFVLLVVGVLIWVRQGRKAE